MNTGASIRDNRIAKPTDGLRVGASETLYEIVPTQVRSRALDGSRVALGDPPSLLPQELREPQRTTLPPPPQQLERFLSLPGDNHTVIF